LEKPEALTTLRRNMINYLNIRSSDHLPCQSELARSGQGVRFFHLEKNQEVNGGVFTSNIVRGTKFLKVESALG
jgi:hypothetical protein